MSNFVLGIEGLVGSGKTSICRELIKKIPNTILVNGGNIYRSIIGMIIKKRKKVRRTKKRFKKFKYERNDGFFKYRI